nr:nitroreductase family protein [Burkholderia cepacia]
MRGAGSRATTAISRTTTRKPREMPGIPAETFTVWRTILSVARHAPSPHNVQPWRVQLISDDCAELFIDGTRTLPKEDTTGAFLLSAMGMFIDAIDLLAAPHGLRVEWQLHRPVQEFAAILSRPTPPGLIPFAALRLVANTNADASRDDPSALMLARRTSRISMDPTPVPDAAVTQLAALADEWGHRYTHLSGAELIEPIIAANIDAVFHDMNVADYHDEITAWFRFTERSTARHRDGLDWRCMNLSRAEFWMSARLSKILTFKPTRFYFKRRYRSQLGHVPAIGVLSGDFFNPEKAIESGRFLLRFWLALTNLGLYLHPYGNLVTNPDAAAWFSTHAGVDRAWLVFKVGYSRTPPQSQRRALADILVDAPVPSHSPLSA